MLARQRHDLIVSTVRRTGSARVRELARDIGVSEVTIRRDLEVLERRGLVDKVHGGATRVAGRSSFEPGFDANQERQSAEKDAIAEAAAALVAPNSAIGISAGTTTWRFAQQLDAIEGLTVVTNAPSIAQYLYQRSDEGLTTQISVLLTGGVRTPSDALVGSLATSALASLHLDMVFLGVHGMDERLGFTTPNLSEAEVNQAFIAAARKVIVLADHTKWMTPGLGQIAPLERADIVISDDRLTGDAHAILSERGVEVVLARQTDRWSSA